MGAWAYGMIGNDEALDAIDVYTAGRCRGWGAIKGVKSAFACVSRPRAFPDWAWAVLGLARHLMKIDVAIPLRCRPLVIRAIQSELVDDTLKRWREPARRRAELYKFWRLFTKSGPGGRYVLNPPRKSSMKKMNPERKA